MISRPAPQSSRSSQKTVHPHLPARFAERQIAEQMTSKLNQVPIIGSLTLDVIRDAGSLSITFPGGEKWVEEGSMLDVRDIFLGRLQPDDREEMLGFLTQISGGETTTISPLRVRGDEWEAIIGIASYGIKNGILECAVLSLDAWVSGYVKADRLQAVNSTYLRIVDWMKASDSRAEAWNHIMGELLSLSEAEFGFMGLREFDEEGQPFLRTKAITNIAWNEETRKLYQERAVAGFEFRNLQALFGPTLRDGEVIISNDYRKETRGVGTPEGHPPLESYLGLPIEKDRRILGMIGVAGKRGGYSDEIVARCLGVLKLLVHNKEFLALFDQVEKSQESMAEEEFSGLMRTMDRLAIPVLSLHENTIQWASLAAGKQLGCLSSLLVNLDLSAPDNVLGMREEIFSDTESASAVMQSSPGGALDRWVTIPTPKGQSLFHLKHLKVGDRDLHQVIDYTQQAAAFQETQEFARKAAEVSQLQSRLVNMISHELRTPLSSLQTSVELIEMGTPETLIERQTPYLENIYYMVGKMTSHIDSVLTFGKVSTGQENVTLNPTDLEDVIESVLSEMIVESVNRIDVQIHDAVKDFVVLADKALLVLAVKNILSNALKFSEDRVDLILSAESKSNSFVELTVRDRGVGIPPEEMGKVFDPFYRAENASRFPGTGIGLALTRGIVRVLKGEIYVDSVPDSGTTVVIRLLRGAS